LGGIDALLAIAQMPPGVPSVSVGIDGAKNAALMAIRILALEDEKLQKALDDYRKKNEEKIRNSRTSLTGVTTAPPEAFL
jgi:phosphoribosylcarboxyaminoimidazole (NCAIR) mutase